MKNKINVNISPNPLDLQTLHCSQNDTEERKFYFTLHNNGEVIDTGEISDPIFEPFSVYKGGTEQLLPINTDDPTTSPIIADIQYPDEEKTEQEFTYRESPTTLDGNAIIEKLYGNTLVWNQLLQELNSTYWVSSSTTPTFSDNSVSFTATAQYGQVYLKPDNSFITITGHKYLLLATIKLTTGTTLVNVQIRNLANSVTKIALATLSNTNEQYLSGIYAESNGELCRARVIDTRASGRDEITAKNIMIFDLTVMFGVTKADEIYAMEQSQSGSGVAYFRSLFPLPYYQYDSGSLLSFNGTGVKVTGKNLFNKDNFLYVEGYNLSGAWNDNKVVKTYPTDNPASITRWDSILIDVSKMSGSIVYSGMASRGGVNNALVDGNFNVLATLNTSAYTTGTINLNLYPSKKYLAIGFHTQDYSVENLQLEFGSSATTYEPYTSSTTSIPTLTYFPTGMKRAGNAFDELTNSKAITRVGSVDLGDLDWSRNTSYDHAFFTATISGAKTYSPNDVCNIKNPKYNAVNCMYLGSFGASANNLDYTFRNASTTIMIRDDTYSDKDTFKSSVNGIYLFYELADEEVTQFTQASLICEDGESTLYQDVDSLVCDCTEDFSKDSGFKDCKIKFTNDDGVVYSNKIQLHIERKP